MGIKRNTLKTKIILIHSVMKYRKYSAVTIYYQRAYYISSGKN